jgi:hypothetical protein
MGGWTIRVYAEHLRERIRLYIVHHAPTYRMKEWTHPLPDVLHKPTRGEFYRYFLGQPLTIHARTWKRIEVYLYPWLLLAWFLPILPRYREWACSMTIEPLFYILLTWTLGFVLQTIRVCYEGQFVTAMGLRSLVMLVCAFVFGALDPGQATVLKSFPTLQDLFFYGL